MSIQHTHEHVVRSRRQLVLVAAQSPSCMAPGGSNGKEVHLGGAQQQRTRCETAPGLLSSKARLLLHTVQARHG
jgi:hypothetical protein